MSDESSSVAPVIGILDSGVGGLSVLREIRHLLPQAPLHYVGDSSWCPYGTKAPELIRRRVTQIADYLLGKGAGLVVIACNSATIHAVEALRSSHPLPVVGMEPGVKPAAERSRHGVVGVLATEASIAGEKFHRLVSAHASGVRIITRPCPRFVELVEAGILSGPEVEAAVAEALDPIVEAGADVIVLGCTHYPFLRPVIEAMLPAGVEIIDTGVAVARRVAHVYGPMDSGSRDGAALRIETTGSLEQLERVLPQLLPGMEAQIGACGL